MRGMNKASGVRTYQKREIIARALFIFVRFKKRSIEKVMEKRAMIKRTQTKRPDVACAAPPHTQEAKRERDRALVIAAYFHAPRLERIHETRKNSARSVTHHIA